MFVPVSCTNCGKPFQVPESGLGKPAPCPWCGAVVTALPVSVPQEPAATQAAGAPESKPEPLSLDDAPPAAAVPVARPRRTPAPREQPAPPASPAKGTRPVFIVALVVIGVLTLGVSMAATLAYLGYGRGQLSGRGWGEFTAPDGSFTVQLPGEPVEEDLPADPGNSLGAGKRFTVTHWYSKTSAWAAYQDLDPGLVAKLPADRDKVLTAGALRAARDREVARFHGTVTKEAEVRVGDAWGVEVHLDTPEGTVIERLLLKGTGSRPRLYVLGVQAKDITPESPACQKLFGQFRANE
jgi:hypothetical protein